MEVLKFNIELPSPNEIEYKKGSYVNWGVNNLYPNWLINLYNDSALHKNIVNIKTNKVFGEGLFYKQSGSKFNLKPNAKYSFDNLIEYLIRDMILFNFFAIEVNYNALGEPIQYNHIPAHQVRSNRDKSHFWVSDDWFKNSKNTFDLPRWTKNSTEKNLQSKIFYFEKRTPSVEKVYPTPDYSGGFKSIMIDIEIDSFNLNNIQNHFSPTSIVSFFQDLTPEQKREKVEHIKKNYTGTNGKKLIIDFVGANAEKGSEVTNISPPDWSDVFQNTVDNVIQKLLVAHSINSPYLVGIKTEGQLGQSTELKNAYKIFYQDYVNVIRTQVEGALNNLLSERKDFQEVELYSQSAFFEDDIESATKEKVMTINEMRDKLGLEPINGGNVLIGSPLAPEPVKEFKQLKNFEKTKVELSEDDYEKVKDLGLNKDEFEVISEEDFHIHSKEDFKKIELKFDRESDIADYIISNDVNGKSLAEIKGALREDLKLDLTTAELKEVLESLNKSGIIKTEISGTKVKVLPAENVDIREVSVVYDYVKRPDVSGAEVISSSRAFCKKLVESNRYYTREDIQSMSTTFGYDIFEFCGGFYYDSVNDVTTPYCRHMWKAVRVAKKK